MRKLTDELLATTTRRFLAGEPMTPLCDEFGNNPTTLRRELSTTGVQLRRPGRPSAVTPSRRGGVDQMAEPNGVPTAATSTAK